MQRDSPKKYRYDMMMLLRRKKDAGATTLNIDDLATRFAVEEAALVLTEDNHHLIGRAWEIADRDAEIAPCGQSCRVEA